MHRVGLCHIGGQFCISGVASTSGPYLTHFAKLQSEAFLLAHAMFACDSHSQNNQLSINLYIL